MSRQWRTIGSNKRKEEQKIVYLVSIDVDREKDYNLVRIKEHSTSNLTYSLDKQKRWVAVLNADQEYLQLLPKFKQAKKKGEILEHLLILERNIKRRGMLVTRLKQMEVDIIYNALAKLKSPTNIISCINIAMQLSIKIDTCYLLTKLEKTDHLFSTRTILEIANKELWFVFNGILRFWFSLATYILNDYADVLRTSTYRNLVYLAEKTTFHINHVQRLLPLIKNILSLGMTDEIYHVISKLNIPTADMQSIINVISQIKCVKLL